MNRSSIWFSIHGQKKSHEVLPGQGEKPSWLSILPVRYRHSMPVRYCISKIRLSFIHKEMSDFCRPFLKLNIMESLVLCQGLNSALARNAVAVTNLLKGVVVNHIIFIDVAHITDCFLPHHSQDGQFHIPKPFVWVQVHFSSLSHRPSDFCRSGIIGRQ